MRKLTPLEEGDWLSLSLEDNGDLVLSLSEFRQYLRDPDCDEQIISLCKAFDDIEWNTNWRMTLERIPSRVPSLDHKFLTECIHLVGDEDGVQSTDRWYKRWYESDSVADLIRFGEIVFVRCDPSLY